MTRVKRALRKLSRVLNICINFGVSNYTFDRSLDVYIELREVLRKPKLYNDKVHNFNLQISILRLEIQW